MVPGVGRAINSLTNFLASLVTLSVFLVVVSKSAVPATVLAVAFLGVLSLFFLGRTIYLELRWRRNVQYARALASINAAFNHIHRLYGGGLPTADEIRTACRGLCNDLSSAFDIITGAECAVSIKCVGSDDGQLLDGEPRLYAFTLCRDHRSERSRGVGDGHDPPAPDSGGPGVIGKRRTVHWVDQNTDYKTILARASRKGKAYFISNRLPSLHGYQNTSFEDYGGEPQVPEVWGPIREFLRDRRWPLPYKSTLVVPITLHSRPGEDLVGFLCVDSPALDAFRMQWDFELMDGVAEGLYNLVKSYRKLVEQPPARRDVDGTNVGAAASNVS